jgi:hypothetical protein
MRASSEARMQTVGLGPSTKVIGSGTNNFLSGCSICLLTPALPNSVTNNVNNLLLTGLITG